VQVWYTGQLGLQEAVQESVTVFEEQGRRDTGSYLYVNDTRLHILLSIFSRPNNLLLPAHSPSFDDSIDGTTHDVISSYSNPNFSGREKELTEIHRLFETSDPLHQRVALFGLGGIG
jgi:hypothetical protein